MGAKKPVTQLRHRFLDRIRRDQFKQEQREKKKAALPPNILAYQKTDERFYRIECKNFEDEQWRSEATYVNRDFADGFLAAMRVFQEPAFARIVNEKNENVVSSYPK